MINFVRLPWLVRLLLLAAASLPVGVYDPCARAGAAVAVELRAAGPITFGPSFRADLAK